jgi:predicted dehydrogenase
MLSARLTHNKKGAAMFDRRDFLKSSAAATAASLTAGFSATARGYFANETINVACIGTGGRCRKLMESLVKIPGVKIAAVCDAWDVHLDMARKMADPQAATSKDYRAILDRKDIDAVLIGAPDHWHVPMTVDACNAGKDVYVEKPLTHDLAEGRAVIDAEARNKAIVQVGMQQRSMPHLQKAKELIDAGQLGEIHKVHLTWNRNTPRHKTNKIDVDPASVDWKSFLGSAKDQPFDAYRFRNWRWFWDFGGGILTDLMVHWMDVANWFCNLDQPESAATIGDQFHVAGLWETPDTIQTLIRYTERPVQVYFEGTFVNARNASMIEVMGSDATLYADRGGMIVFPERNSKTPKSEMILGEGPRGADFYTQPDGELLHLTNWIECIRSRKTPTAPVAAGVQAVYAAHLGNRAYRTGQVAKWSESAPG